MLVTSHSNLEVSSPPLNVLAILYWWLWVKVKPYPKPYPIWDGDPIGTSSYILVFAFGALVPILVW